MAASFQRPSKSHIPYPPGNLHWWLHKRQLIRMWNPQLFISNQSPSTNSYINILSWTVHYLLCNKICRWKSMQICHIHRLPCLHCLPSISLPLQTSSGALDPESSHDSHAKQIFPGVNLWPRRYKRQWSCQQDSPLLIGSHPDHTDAPLLHWYQSTHHSSVSQ
jgi:hypothetical protein